MTHLTLEDYRSTGADESYSEGVVDHLRSVEGTAVAGLIRDLLGNGESPKRKVSLRATDDRVDVSRIARAQGGGGHRRAAGFSTDLDFPELVEFLRGALSEQLVTDGVLLVDKPAGVTSHDVVAAQRRRLGRGVKVGHAGTLDPFATGLLLVLVGRATRVQRFLMALPKRYETVARLGWTSTTGDPEGEIAPGRMPEEPFALPTGTIRQRPPAYSAVKVGGERAYALARRGEAVEIPEREVQVTRFDLAWRDGERAGFEIECSSGHLRALADRRPRRRLLPRAAPDGDRRVRRGRRRRRAHDRARRRAGLHARRRAVAATTPAAPATASRSAARPRASSACATMPV